MGEEMGGAQAGYAGMPFLTEEGAPTCINLLGSKVKPVCTLGAHREPRVYDVPQPNTEGTALNPVTPCATRKTSVI